MTQGGSQITARDYTPLGQLSTVTQYNQPNVASFVYGADGTVSTYTDANGRVVSLSNWYRGAPQTIRKAVGTSDEITVSQTLNSNGWVTSATDANGNTATYGYNNMGWLELVNPPDPITPGATTFNSTNITYAFNDPTFGGIRQTITRGSATTNVYHDAMNRVRRTEQSSLGWSATSDTTFDAIGRVAFQSRPYTTGDMIYGVSKTYDALGRLKRTEDTYDPLVFSDYSYHTNNRTRVDRPGGRYTITSRSGYSGPGNGQVTQIAESGATGTQRETYLYRNDFDSLTWLRQIDYTGANPKEISQHFVHDAQQRVCAHYVPEHGETRYTYDAAGQLITYAKGLNRTAYSGTTTCACTAVTSPGPLVTLSYDALGRLLTKDFDDPSTLDVENVYDDNGNLTRSLRRPLGGAVSNEFFRTYDELNNILTEQQIVVGAPTSMTLTYTYDANGFMTSRHYPSNMQHTWTNDGFGHQQNLLHDSASYASNITYHPDGSLKGYTAGNGQVFTREVDDLQRTELPKSVGAITALDLTYAYDASSRITSIMDGIPLDLANNPDDKDHEVTNLQYDALGHMTNADGWWGTGTFEYDGFGNLGKRWLGVSDPNNSRRIWNFYDSNNRVFVTDDSLATTSGGAGWHSHSYDARGNMTRSGSSLNNAHTMFMTYDMSDQMVGMSGHNLQEETLSAAYQYNGVGKRVYTLENGRESYLVYDAGGALRTVYKSMTGNGRIASACKTAIHWPSGRPRH